MMDIGGLQIIESQWMIRTVNRTWRERLLGWPWQPWRETKTVSVEVPIWDIYQIGDKLICHPAMARKIRDAVNNREAINIPGLCEDSWFITL